MTRIALAIQSYRKSYRYSVRVLAREIGISAATLNRIEHGNACDGATMLKIINWLWSEPK